MKRPILLWNSDATIKGVAVKLLCPRFVIALTVSTLSFAGCKCHEQTANSGAATVTLGSSSVIPFNLHCEHRRDPPGIDTRTPRLSWILTPANRGDRGLYQSAYQIRVASNPAKLDGDSPDLWNSGKVLSSATSQIMYDGVPLESGLQCWWQVRVWDHRGRVSEWSDPSQWSMGLLKPEDWSAQWIGYINVATPARKLPQATYWRKEITTGKRIVRATLYASALGSHVTSINGRRVGGDYFDSGWTDFRKRVYYRTYDVTEMLQPGRNTLSAILSTGWYAGYIWGGPFNYGSTPKLLLQLNVEYVDGTRQTLGTGPDWKVSYGPLLEADIQQGETCDARLDIPNWNLVGFDDSGWATPNVVQDAVPVRVERDNSLAQLEAAPHPPVRRQREIKPVRLSYPRPGTYVFDLGESIAGWAKLKVKGPPGTSVVLRFSGMLNPDGTIYTNYLREARVVDTYVIKGAGEEETWEPLFTYHGFQYVEMTGYPGVASLDTITGVACHSDLERTGNFECSDARVNRLYKNCIDSIIANFVDLPTGCSDRAERLGWMGLGQMIYSWCYSYDMNAFLEKWMRDIVDAQSLGKSGAYLQVSPIWGDIESPGWSDDGVCVPYALYRFYGNTNIIEDNYESLKKYLAHIERSLSGYLRTGAVYHVSGEKFIGYGDWLAIVENRELHADVLNTLWNGWSVSNMAEMAEGIGRKDDAAKYRQLLKNMRSAFNEAYVSPDGKVKHDTQGEYALGLYFGFFAEDKVPLAVDHLVEDITRKSHTEARENPSKKPRVIPPGHLTTGFHSSRALLPVLSRNGQNAVAYKLLLQDTYPSWLYPVTHGATSSWERWDSWHAEAGFQDPRMNSFGMPHLMASVTEWLVGYVGGIQTDGIGHKSILVKPYVGEGLDSADASFQSINGLIRVQWHRMKGGGLTLNVLVPPNTKATIAVPKNGLESVAIYESGAPLWTSRGSFRKIEGITAARNEADCVSFQVVSGSFEFLVQPQ